ncbi:hypothetical protein MMC29_005874 [Sticta canariensis]|nr:hypothetical protein [Sticta canariensis]
MEMDGWWMRSSGKAKDSGFRIHASRFKINGGEQEENLKWVLSSRSRDENHWGHGQERLLRAEAESESESRNMNRNRDRNENDEDDDEDDDEDEDEDEDENGTGLLGRKKGTGLILHVLSEHASITLFKIMLHRNKQNNHANCGQTRVRHASGKRPGSGRPSGCSSVRQLPTTLLTTAT